MALKIRDAHSTFERDELLAEARLLLNLRPHPGVPLVREDFLLSGRYHMVMDWVEGIDLSRLLAQAGEDGLPYQEVQSYLAQVADALDHLHGHDPPIVHKDVKPANVVVDARGRAVLVDFGISTNSERSLGRSGTTGYVAPEVCAGEPATPTSDVFSLAATAYFALTGAVPEPGARPRWRGVPDSMFGTVQAALSRGLALDPARRPPSARAFVELLAPPRVPHNLPAPLTAFVGRQRELGQLARALRASRLVTLAGPGGVGKTRLAIELAGETAWTYPDGVWLVELAPVAAEFVTATVGTVLNVKERPGRSLLEALVDQLRDRQLLLILDNCEHALDAVAPVAETLLRTLPGLRVLTTTREPLDVFGELVVRVPPMSFPAPDDVALGQALTGFDAVDLFCERAGAADPDFHLTAEGAHDVALLCATLDGIPLALEMAASRLRHMALSALAADLDGALELRGSRTAPSRQRTLAATIDWSYDLLDEEAAAQFRRLSVFAGGFGVDAVEAVCSTGGGRQSDVGDLLRSLVDRSMVVDMAIGSDGSARFRLLETLRAFAEERAVDAQELQWLTLRHGEWFLSRAERAASDLFGPEEGNALDRLEADNADMRLALRRALDGGRPEVALRLAVALSRFWNVRGYWAEARDSLEAALSEAASAPPSLRAKALAAATLMAERQADFRAATRYGEEAVELARAANDKATAAEALGSLSDAAQSQGQVERAEALLEEALAEWRASGVVTGVASSVAGTTLGGAGWRAFWRGAYEDAERLFTEALAVADDLGITRARSYSLLGRAAVAHAQGRLAEARGLLAEATVISEQLQDRRFLGLESFMRSVVALDDGDIEAASLGFQMARAEASQGGDTVLAIRALEGIARVGAHRGDFERAAEVLGSAAAQRDAISSPVATVDESWYTSLVARLRRELGDVAFETAWDRGRSADRDDARQRAR